MVMGRISVRIFVVLCVATSALVTIGAKLFAVNNATDDCYVYNGDSFQKWRHRLRVELNPTIRIQGLRAMGMFGRKAYPSEAATAILTVMHDYEFEIQFKSFQHLTPAEMMNLGAIRIVTRCQTPELGEVGVNALTEIGQSTLPLLEKVMLDKSSHLRRFAIIAFAELLPRSSRQSPEEGLELLIRAVHDPDQMVAKASVILLGRLGPSAKRAEPALKDLVRREERRPDAERQREEFISNATGVSSLKEAIQRSLWNISGRYRLKTNLLGEISESLLP
jgi:hypothetical protein